MRLSTLQSFQEVSLVAGIALIGLLVGCGAAGGGSGGGGPGITCSCGGGGPSPRTQNRVHISNGSNQPGIRVVLTAGSQTCTINELIVTAPGDGIELDQCLVEAGIGDTVDIAATTGAAQGAAAACVVDATSIVPGVSEEPQTFAGVFIQPVSVVCALGFAL